MPILQNDISGWKKIVVIKYFKQLLRKKIIRNVIVVVTGAAGAQAITVAFTPLITRLYGPEAFGILGTFVSVLSLVTPVAAFTYPIAIVLPKSDQDAMALARISAALAFMAAAFLSLLVLLCGKEIVHFLNLESINDFLYLIPLAMLLSAFYQIFQQWVIRQRKFKISAKAALIQALSLNSAKVSIGWFLPFGGALIVISTMGYALHALLLYLGAKKRKIPSDFLKEKMTVSDIKDIALKYKDFPMFRAPQAFVNALSHSLPVLMLASFLGPSAAGFYTLSKSVMTMPITLLSKSVGDVFYPRITKAEQEGENVYELMLKATIMLAALGVAPFMTVFLFGPTLFSFVFGNEWSTAGNYASWISLWLFGGFVNRPCVVAIPVLGLLSHFLIYEVVSLLVRAISLFIGLVLYGDGVTAVAIFSLSGLALNFVLIVFVMAKSRRGR